MDKTEKQQQLRERDKSILQQIVALEQERDRIQGEIERLETQGEQPWPRRVMVDSDKDGDISMNVAYFAERVCCWEERDKEYESMYEIGERSYLYYDVYPDGTYILVGARDGDVCFGDCTEGDYTEAIANDKNWHF